MSLQKRIHDSEVLLDLAAVLSERDLAFLDADENPEEEQFRETG